MSTIACNAKSLYEYSSDATDELDLVPGDLLPVLVKAPLAAMLALAIPVGPLNLLPFWPENVRSRRPLHLLQSMHFNDLSLNTILR